MILKRGIHIRKPQLSSRLASRCYTLVNGLNACHRIKLIATGNPSLPKPEQPTQAAASPLQRANVYRLNNNHIQRLREKS